MIVDDLRQDEVDPDLVERSARLRWKDGAARLWVRAPRGLTTPPSDASPYLAAALPLAMRRGEDLEVRGSVSPLLLARAELIQSVFGLWNPWLDRIRVRAEAEEARAPASDAVAAYFSRGVDSSYTATGERHGLPALTHLLFVDGLDLHHDAAVRAEEVRLAGKAAAAIGMPLVVVASNVRELSEPLFDWLDMAGAGLSFVALSMGGLLGRAVIPSSDTYMSLAPNGTHPLLEPMFSTEGIEVEHDHLERSRTAKVAWIAERRPELLEYLKVCIAENRPDNCGRCDKCVLTMAALQAAGALERATGFPDRMDPEKLRLQRVGLEWFSSRYEVAEACRVLPADGEGGRTRRALLDALADRGPLIDPYETAPMETFRLHYGRSVLSLTRDGRPYPLLEDGDGLRPGPLSLGLVRAVDPVAHRHLYGIGSIPPGEPVEELGSLRATPPPAGLPAWLSPEGYVMSAEYRPPPVRRSMRQSARWTLAPLSWRGFAPLRVRARAVAWRLRRLVAGPAPPASPPEGEPIGYLNREGGLGRRPLYSALHPVTGDQLLATSPRPAREMGYVEVVLLGHLEEQAPLTGQLGPQGAPVLPWASRWGRTAA
jgi:hypothetical protein